MQKTKGRRGKVALQPGHSALDWARIASSGKDLRGTDVFPLRVTLAELKTVSVVSVSLIECLPPSYSFI